MDCVPRTESSTRNINSISLVLFCVDAAQEAVKKRRRATKKPYSRSIIGATWKLALEVIQKKRAEKPEVRDAARETALTERIKKTKDEKKAKKAEFASKQQKIQAKIPKAAAKEGPKLGGGGGK
ncbi:unnamed protein product, partial [Brassica rapa]